jgi:hypothetical protein
MSAVDPCLIRSRDRSGGLVVRVGLRLVDDYLEFLGGRCRPNTLLAAGYDLKVFFSVVGKAPDEVRPADVLAFITAQGTGRVGERGALQPVDLEGASAGVSTSTVRRRLSIVSERAFPAFPFDDPRMGRAAKAANRRTVMHDHRLPVTPARQDRSCQSSRGLA